MAENQSKCTGNCMACTIFQRQYCASQLAYSNMKMLEQMQQSIAGVLVNMKSLSDKIDAIQNSEAALFDPMGNDNQNDNRNNQNDNRITVKAQEGDGAEE